MVARTSRVIFLVDDSLPREPQVKKVEKYLFVSTNDVYG